MNPKELNKLVKKNILNEYDNLLSYITINNIDLNDFPEDIFYLGDPLKVEEYVLKSSNSKEKPAKVTVLCEDSDTEFAQNLLMELFDFPFPDITKPYRIFSLKDGMLFSIVYTCKDGAIAAVFGKDLKRAFDFMLGEYHNIYKDNLPKESNCKVTGIR